MKNNWQIKKLGKIDSRNIKKNIRIAFNLLFKNDAFLLEKSAHERSITHKLAEYLQQQFIDWHVDCEYNRHGILIKILPRECNGKNEKYVYPDIIIHHRNTDNNLVVFEIKLKKLDTVDVCDNKKLIEFTKHSGKYRYTLGVFIGFDGLNEPQIVFYQDGNIIEL